MSARRYQFCAWLAFLVCVIPLLQAVVPKHRIAAADLDRLVQDKRYPELQAQLPVAKLTPAEHTYFSGILADRSNHTADAITALEQVLPELRKTSRKRTAIALRTLASDYFRTGEYGKSSDTYSELLKDFAAEFTQVERQTITDNRNTFELLRGALPQTVSGEREFRVPIRHDALSDMTVPVQIGSATEWWIFDTGANESTISLSTAKRLGLNISRGQASTQSGSTGKEVPLWVAVIPEMTFGKAVVRNVAVIVSEDSALNVNLGENGHYQIQGVLGYPVLAALGSLTIAADELEVSPESKPSSRSTRLWVEELTPLLEAKVDGRDLLFGLDTGSDAGTLSRLYLRAFPQQFASLKPRKWGTGGVGGIRRMSAYDLPRLDLHLGSATATLKNVPVMTIDLGVDPLDWVYGNLGQSLLKQFRSYTIDFSRMRFIGGENAD